MVQLKLKIKEGFDVTTENFNQLVEQIFEIMTNIIEKEDKKVEPMPSVPKTWEEGFVAEEELTRRRMKEILEKDNVV